MNSKQNKNKENYILAHHNQTIKTKNRKIYLKILESPLPGFCTLVLEVMERRRERVGRGWTKWWHSSHAWWKYWCKGKLSFPPPMQGKTQSFPTVFLSCVPILFTQNTSLLVARSVVIFPHNNMQTSDTSWVSYTWTQFWHSLQMASDPTVREVPHFCPYPNLTSNASHSHQAQVITLLLTDGLYCRFQWLPLQVWLIC